MIQRPKRRKSYEGEKIGYINVGKAYSFYSGDCEIREYDCHCEACGSDKRIRHRVLTIAKSHYVREGKNVSCGCLQYQGFEKHNAKKQDLTGMRFGALTVLSQSDTVTMGKDKKKRRTWKCRCKCGTITYVSTGDLVSGNTKSCGCLKSAGEAYVAQALEKQNIFFEKEYSFDDLITPFGNPLRFDFAVFEANKLSFLIEYQGEQHYTPYATWFGAQQRKYTDKQKKEYCEKNGIRLFEIAYDEDIDERIREIMQSVHGNTVPSLTM